MSKTEELKMRLAGKPKIPESNITPKESNQQNKMKSLVAPKSSSGNS